MWTEVFILKTGHYIRSNLISLSLTLSLTHTHSLFIYMCVCVCVWERERERERDREKERYIQLVSRHNEFWIFIYRIYDIFHMILLESSISGY